MAHYADTGIQQHSVGPLFPAVIYRRTLNGVDDWGVLYRGHDFRGYGTYDDAADRARSLTRQRPHYPC